MSIAINEQQTINNFFNLVLNKKIQQAKQVLATIQDQQVKNRFFFILENSSTLEEIYEQIGLQLLAAGGIKLLETGDKKANLFFKKAFYSGEKWKYFLNNDLYNYFQANKSALKLHKWIHYFQVYDRFFAPFRNKEINFLEIGVFGGGSLAMWKDYFGAKANIYGIDINPECKQYESERISISIGSQDDPNFLENVAANVGGSFDIILDDGGHTMNQQKVSLETLFKYLKKGGIYMVEDCCTSYWPSFGGGLKKPDSFIEYSKNLVDYINRYYNELFLQTNGLAKEITSISFFDSIIVFEKEHNFPPFDEMMGIQ